MKQILKSPYAFSWILAILQGVAFLKNSNNNNINNNNNNNKADAYIELLVCQ